jgi:hypothetical protein
MEIKQQKGVFIFVIAYSYARKSSINKRIDDYFVTVTDNEPVPTEIFREFYQSNQGKGEIEITNYEIYASYHKKSRIVTDNLIKAIQIIYKRINSFKIVGILENENDYVFGLRCHNGSIPILGSLPAIRKKDLSYHAKTVYNDDEYLNMKPTWQSAIVLHNYK